MEFEIYRISEISGFGRSLRFIDAQRFLDLVGVRDLKVPAVNATMPSTAHLISDRHIQLEETNFNTFGPGPFTEFQGGSCVDSHFG